jgi:hypothetical protein
MLSSVDLYEKTKTYDFGFGFLTFQAFKASSADGLTTDRGREDLRLKVSFLPPSWMSRTSLQAIIDIPGQSSAIIVRATVRLQATTCQILWSQLSGVIEPCWLDLML